MEILSKDMEMNTWMTVSFLHPIENDAEDYQEHIKIKINPFKNVHAFTIHFQHKN